jgi:hypothetical protein
MLGLNTTGNPDSRDYLLGRACVFLSENDSTSGLPTCYRPVGNTPNLSVSVDIEELTHRASHCQQFGGAVIDRRLIIQQTLNLSMTLEELNHENVAIFFQGTTDNPANPAVAGVAEFELTDNLALDCWYPLSSGGVRLLGIDEANLTVEEQPATLLIGGGDDYEVDETMGLIRFKAGGTGALTGGEGIDVTVAADAGAPATIERVNALKASQTRHSVKAIVENANNNNEQVEMEFHSVLLVGDGDLAVVGDELAQMGLTGVAESNSSISGSPTLTISTAVG